MRKYCNLNVISEYCLLSSTLKIDDYLEFAEQQNIPILAIADKNTMYGAMRFYQECIIKKIKPIIGLTVDVYFDAEDLQCEIVIYAVNDIGYQNLCQISSLVMTKSVPLITAKELKKYLNNIILVIKNNFHVNKLQKYWNEYKNYIAVYLGLSVKDLENINELQNYSIDLVAFNCVRYLYSEESKSLQVLNAIKNQTLLIDEDIEPFLNQYYLTNNNLWLKYDNSLIDNVNKIINCIDLKLKFNVQQNLLVYPTPNKINSFDYLKQICYENLHIKKLNNDTYNQRLEYELNIIKKTGFADYFLIVWDYVQFARDNNIMVGPGRGSVSGSLVAFLLNICDIDAIKYSLLFERFLNPDRITMPDIDIDFQDDRREEIIQYLVKKYGIDHVSHIITFQAITAKIAIKDTARVLNISLDDADKISKAIPLDLNFNLQNAVDKINILQIYEQNYPQLFQIAKTLIGLPRQIGTHAAGIVLSQQKLFKIIPVQKGYNEIFLTQYSMGYLEDLGLLKMDLLGLRNLTIISEILKMIKNNLRININLLEIPLDDKKTYELLAKGLTTGIFQLESSGMRQLLKLIVPKQLEDIVVASSLFRPGPADHIQTYIKRKNNPKLIEYVDSKVIDILESTYGIMIYQEQVMLIAQRVANFTLAKADLLRRAISKKDHHQMQLLRQQFIKQGLQNGYSEQKITKIWEWISDFADYGFNRSHAIAYSLLGYWMAYLKTNYFIQFICCLLTSVINVDDKINQYINECRHNKIAVLSPSVNFSQNIFSNENNQIRFAITAIKQIGDNFYEQLRQERDTNGLFADYIDFVIRMSHRGLNSRILMVLIDSGALDEFGFSRKTLSSNLQKVLLYGQLVTNEKNGQINFNYETIAAPSLEIYNDDIIEKSQKEKNALGFFLNSHPLVALKEKLKLDSHLVKIQNLENLVNKIINCLVIINRVKEIKTKNNDYMAFMTISDEYGTIDVSVFSRYYQMYSKDIKENNIIFLTAKVDNYQGKIQLILNKMRVVNLN